ncbi:ATP-binding cassette sub-family A member 17-like isoform X2 [Dermacentor albipictus]|uniref:ATP-binding cassette sub-family A member 17-like isoform X2 n=1 Tax=Dermacentor albipictus TaxID=60249 RepID=UPI0038FC5772
MLERVLFLRTRCRRTLLGAMLPVLVLVAAFQWMAAGQPKRENATSSVIRVPVSLRELYPDARVFLDDDDEARKGISPYYVYLLKEEGAKMAHYDGKAGDVLLQEARADYVSYTSRSVLGAVFRDEELQAWFNPYAIMSKSLAFDLVCSALLAFNTGSYWARFETTLAVHVPQVLRQQRTRRLKGDPGAEHYDDDPMGRVDEQVHSMAAVWALMGPLALALIASSFVAFPSAESSSGFMRLVLMTGVPGWLHCLCNVMFDLALYVWVVVPVSAAFACYFQLHFISYKALLWVFAMTGILCILSAYDIAYWSRSACRAHVTAFIWFGVTGLVTFYTTVWMSRTGRDIDFLCTPLPQCAVPMAVIKVVALDWSRRACRRLAITKLDNITALVAFCRKTADYEVTYQEDMFAGLLKTHVDMCCAMLDADLRDTIDWSPLKATRAGVGLELYYMWAEAVILFAYLSCRNSGRFFRLDSVGTPSRGSADTEVIKERCTVRRICAEGAQRNYALVAQEVHKWYGDDYAVCGFNLALPRDECFGLLGVYGCGKSSVARMLAAVTVMTLGEAHMDGARLSDSPRAWQSQVGFCPEEDALLDALSGYELLELFARLRGVRSDKTERLVDSVVGVTDLNECARNMCGTYSAGARRKLSIALAIIGAPRVVILDDATRGVDITGREMIYEALRDITRVAASAVILTSRSTEECEKVCTRVGLMAGGELKALGSMKALRESYSAGFAVTFTLVDKFTSYMISKVDKAVTQLFPGARRADCREGIFVYHVASKLPWSEVFSRLDAMRQGFELESVLVAESSLDEVLLGMGRAEMAEDAAASKWAAVVAFDPSYKGDPWGRDRQGKHERRQKVREFRRKDDAATRWP